MDDRVSPFYNPYNHDDITTVMGSRRMEEMWDSNRSPNATQVDPGVSRFVFFLLVGVFTALGLVNWAIG